MKILRNKMCQIGLLAVLPLLTYAGEQTQEGWTENNKQGFTLGCVKNLVRNNVPKVKAKEICFCSLNKVMDTYPSFRLLQKRTKAEFREEMTKNLQLCIFSQKTK